MDCSLIGAVILVVLAFFAPAAPLAPAAPRAPTALVAARQATTDPLRWPTAGWSSVAPEEQGMDRALLEEAARQGGATWPFLTSLLAARGGDLVLEAYYNGQEPDQPREIWSATKSFTATGVGIAIGEGRLRLDQTVGELIPDRIPAGADPRAAAVTVEQLLSMTSGFAWNSSTDYSFAFDEVDLTARTLGLPFACDPGSCYEYNSGNIHLLSAIVQAVTDETLADYLQPRLFDPLGIPRPVWRQSIAGETLGAVGLSVTPGDLAKLGWLYLNGGVWEGRQIVPADFVAAATSVQSAGTNAAGVNLSGGAAYGYGWWVTEVAGLPAYFGLGYGEQVVFVVPALDLVAVATSDPEIPVEQLQYPRRIIERLIVPAAW